MTKIPWTEQTYNPIIGCSKISPGCDNCYAERMACRLASMDTAPREYRDVVGQPYNGSNPFNGWNGKIALIESALDKPLKRKKPTMYFTCSMGDLFHKSVPDEWIDQVIQVMALCGHRWLYPKSEPEEGTETPGHQFQVLTKRPKRMYEYLLGARDMWDSWAGRLLDYVYANGWPLPNLWLGVTAENQQQADKRIPYFLITYAPIRFISIEPLLEAMDICQYLMAGIATWVIVGCESGPNRRPCKIEWVESIVGQCQLANVPVFVKQLDIGGKVSKDPAEWPEHLRAREFPEIQSKGLK